MAKRIAFCLILLLGLVTPFAYTEAEMTSDNYVVYADVVSVGGSYSSGGNYVVEDTMGETPVGVVSSTSYTMKGGYQYMEVGLLSINISDTSLSLGTLSQNSLSQAASTITISTDSDSGYSLSFSSVSGSTITAVSDGSVTLGQEEYGVAVGGVNRVPTTDVGVVSGLLLSSTSTSILGDTTTLTFKASRTSVTTPGTYSQSINITASGNI